MATEVEETSELLRQHLESAGLSDGYQQVWTLAPSPLGGRGVVAKRDIAAGELIFYDAPLVVGPRAGLHCPPLCVGCHDGPPELLPCSQGCGLPICSPQCESSPRHLQECERLRAWVTRARADRWSPNLLRAATPIRCLEMSPLQRQVMMSLQYHTGEQHAYEIELIKKNTLKGPSPEDEEFMRLACCIMDANAFETARISKELIKNTSTFPSLRGLYPLAAMMNHACTPNTRHGFDVDQNMIVRATMRIPAGTEITNSYTALLWGTPARRHHLDLTKHFLCECPRCADPQEGGSRLTALKCLTQTCSGSVFPINSLDEESSWRCEECGREFTGRKAALTQCSLGRLLGCADTRNPVHMERFLQEHLQIAPTSNQIVVEVKCNLIRIYGHTKDYMWSELPEEVLERKEQLCRELLLLLAKLGAGACRMRGLLLYELHCTLMELWTRWLDNKEKKGTIPHLVQEAFTILQESHEILSEDITAPLDLRHRMNVCKEAFDNL